MTWIATGIAVVGVVTAAAGTVIQVRSQKAQAQAAQDTADYNAQVARNEALQTQEAAAENVRRKTEENRRLTAALNSSNAANGLALTGTPLAVLGDTQTALQRDILDIGYAANNRSKALISGANLSLWQGDQQASALKTQQTATIISGVGSAAKGYLSSTGKV